MKSFQIKTLSSLVKAFSDEEPKQPEVFGHSALRNEKTSFQVAVCADRDRNVFAEVSSDLGTAVRLYEVKELDSGISAWNRQDNYTLRREAGLFPELLLPTDGAFRTEKGKWRCLWIAVEPDAPLAPGAHEIRVSFRDGGERLGDAVYRLEIVDALLPKQTLIYTNWFHTDCLANRYRVEIFSEEYWKITEAYLKAAVEYGMNAVLTPLFTPPLDTVVGGERPTVQLVDVRKEKNGYRFGFEKLERWIEMCDRAGAEYFEMSHLFTQWGAKHAPKIVAEVRGKRRKIFGWSTRAAGKKYGGFLDAFAAELNRFLAEKGVAKRCIFHVSDEPGKKFLRHYSRAAEIVKRNFGNYPIVDALSDYDFYEKGVVKLPIPANDAIEPFLGNVPELWTYYCSAQHTKYVSNRFFNMPSQRNRILGYQMYKFNVKGFLHWGYNYWYSRLSKREIDPFTVTDAGHAFPAGDSFVVYPGASGTPLYSLRLKVFYDGLQDLRALRLLETLTSRKHSLTVLEEAGEVTFSSYPKSDAWHLETRERINRAIADAVAEAKADSDRATVKSERK